MRGGAATKVAALFFIFAPHKVARSGSGAYIRVNRVAE